MVTTMSRQAVSESTKKPTSTVNWPAGIHRQNDDAVAVLANGAAPVIAPADHDHRHEPTRRSMAAARRRGGLAAAA